MASRRVVSVSWSLLSHLTGAIELHPKTTISRPQAVQEPLKMVNIRLACQIRVQDEGSGWNMQDLRQTAQHGWSTHSAALNDQLGRRRRVWDLGIKFSGLEASSFSETLI